MSRSRSRTHRRRQRSRASVWLVACRLLAALALWAGAMRRPALAAEEQLPIGLSDFPRKVQRELRSVSPTRQLKVGPLELHPLFETDVEFDDNIRLADEDAIQDVIFIQRPALIGEMRLGDHRLEAGYGMERLDFVKVSEENATNHLAHAIGELNFNDVQFRLSETMEDSTGRLFNETSGRDHVFLNTSEILGRFDRPQWAAESAWTHNIVDHKSSNRTNNDYGEDVLSLLAGYKVTERTLVLVEPTVGVLNYNHNVTNADQTYWQLMGGLRGELTEKLTALLKLGFQRRTMSDVASQGQLDDFNGVVADADVTFKPDMTDTVELTYARRPFPSTFSNNSWYRLDKVALSYRKRLARKWVVVPTLGWQMNDYPEAATVNGVTKRRRDNFAQAGLAVRYEIQDWLSTGVRYNFRMRNANLPTLDYDNNRVAVDVTVAF